MQSESPFCVSRCARFTLRAPRIEIFSGGACPQTHLDACRLHPHLPLHITLVPDIPGYTTDTKYKKYGNSKNLCASVPLRECINFIMKVWTLWKFQPLRVHSNIYKTTLNPVHAYQQVTVSFVCYQLFQEFLVALKESIWTYVNYSTQHTHTYIYVSLTLHTYDITYRQHFLTMVYVKC